MATSTNATGETVMTLSVEGLALWAPALPGWPEARAAFRGEAAPLAPAQTRPAPQLLPPAERRRAPDTVALALEVATRAVDSAGLSARDLPSVFVSAHGDLAITDYMGATLARAPTMLSPTRFHNSVHNAASGYWSIATGCMQPATALSAFEQSFAAGLLEAATLCLADQTPVLLVGYDVGACGALVSVTRSTGLLAVALVLAPAPSGRSLARLECNLQPARVAGKPVAAAAGVMAEGASAGAAVPGRGDGGNGGDGEPAAGTPLRSAAAQALAGNAMAGALPLFEALADAQATALLMPLTSVLMLQVRVWPRA
jgi:hypothetical protein